MIRARQVARPRGAREAFARVSSERVHAFSKYGRQVVCPRHLVGYRRELLGGAAVQSGARRHGIDGIHGNLGNMGSVTYRF